MSRWKRIDEHWNQQLLGSSMAQPKKSEPIPDAIIPAMEQFKAKVISDYAEMVRRHTRLAERISDLEQREKPMSLLDKLTRDDDNQFHAIMLGSGVLMSLIAVFGVWLCRGTTKDSQVTAVVSSSPSASSVLSEEAFPSPTEETAAVATIEPPVLRAKAGTQAIPIETPRERFLADEFQTPLLAKRVLEHRNGPWVLIPKDATTEQLRTFAVYAEAILQRCQERQEQLLAEFPDDPMRWVSFRTEGAQDFVVRDPRMLENDRDRQRQLMDTLRSIWPKAAK
jgi:hypothetical protein